MPYNLPYKVANKLKRELNRLIGKPYIQRNWELQFLGQDNGRNLRTVLQHSKLNDWIGKHLLNEYVESFYSKNPLEYAHGINMLLVLAKFHENISKY